MVLAFGQEPSVWGIDMEWPMSERRSTSVGDARRVRMAHLEQPADVRACGFKPATLRRATEPRSAHLLDLAVWDNLVGCRYDARRR